MAAAAACSTAAPLSVKMVTPGEPDDRLSSSSSSSSQHHQQSMSSSVSESGIIDHQQQIQSQSQQQQQQQVVLPPQPKTLYVGNLDPSVTDELLHGIFAPLGHVIGCKIIHESGNDPYAFIEFGDHASASMALSTMNKRSCLGRELKVNWATSSASGTGGNTGVKMDTSRHHHIFIGDLAPEIETNQLRDAFSPFGDISDCRVVRDATTLKSKGYGFVSFVKKHEAEHAINTMNGQWLGSRAIRTNWATRKPSNPRINGTGQLGMNGSPAATAGPGNNGNNIPSAPGIMMMMHPHHQMMDPATAAAAHAAAGPGNGSHLHQQHLMQHHHNNGSGGSNSNHHSNYHNANISMNGGGGGGGGKHHHHHHHQLSFEEIYSQSSPTNCTVYCGGIMSGLSDELIKSTFSPFGLIHEVRVFKDKGYAFIKFASKESAAAAIMSLNGSDIMGNSIKCSWGKESGDPNNQLNSVAAAYASAAAAAAAAAAAGYPSPYAHISPAYWYPGAATAGMNAAGYPQALALAVAAAQQQQQQQQQQHHFGQGYGQYYGSAGSSGSGVNNGANGGSGNPNTGFNSAAAAAAALAAANMQMQSWHQQQQQQSSAGPAVTGANPGPHHGQPAGPQQQSAHHPLMSQQQHGIHSNPAHHPHSHSGANAGPNAAPATAGPTGLHHHPHSHPHLHPHHAAAGAYLQQQAPYQAQ